MSGFLSWLWTKAELSSMWRRIAVRRHRSELSALRRARVARRHKALPIFRTVLLWYFAFGIPGFLTTVLGVELMHDGHDDSISYLGGMIFSVAMAYSLVFTVLVIPWFFRWYCIAVGLMFGRTAMADRKEAELVAAIAEAERARLA